MKKRGFDADETERADAPAALRTEPAPHAGKAIAAVLASWVLPLWMIVSIFTYSEDDEATRAVHRVIAITSAALLLIGLGLAIRAIDLARKNVRMRRHLAYGVVVLALVTPIVWAAELMLAGEVFLTRERLEAQQTDASSSAAE